MVQVTGLHIREALAMFDRYPKYIPLETNVTAFLSAGRKYMMKECNDFVRVDAGHHEGFIEVFGNVYRGFCGDVAAHKIGRVYDGPAYPTAEDGLSGQRFISACVRSEKNGNTWERLE